MAIADVALALRLSLLLGHVLPCLGAEALAARLLSHLGEQALRRTCGIARITHKQGLLRKTVHADGVGGRTTIFLPAVLAKLRDVLFTPALEEPKEVHEGEEALWREVSQSAVRSSLGEHEKEDQRKARERFMKKRRLHEQAERLATRSTAASARGPPGSASTARPAPAGEWASRGHGDGVLR